MNSSTYPRRKIANNVISCLGGGRTRLEQRDLKPPRMGELLIKTRVVGLCGTDLFKLSTDNVSEGTVLGHEIVGEIIELGSGIAHLAIGDRVVVPHHVSCGSCLFCQNGSETMCEKFRENLIEPGGFADHVIVKHRATTYAAHKIPDNISDKTAVFLEPAACVLRGINRSELQSNGNAAIMGGGSMGLLHLLIIKAVNPNAKTLLIDPLEDRRVLAKNLGADMTSEPGKSALSSAMEMTNGCGVDSVFDTVGGAKLLEAGIKLSRKGGTVILFAHASDDACASFNLNSIFKYERRIIGTYSGALAEQSSIFNLIKTGSLDPSPLISHTMPLDQFAAAHKLAESSQALKILFTPSRSAVNT